MEFPEIKEKLETLGIPVAYMKFNTPQKLPFVVYREAGAVIQGADNYNLYRDVTIEILLYCETKNVKLERNLEALFYDTEIHKSPDIYLSDENMYEIGYSFDTIQEVE